MKKTVALLLAAAMLLALAACGGGTLAAPAQTAAPQTQSTPAPEAEPVTLIVFAAASMTETITRIAEMYRQAAPNVTLTLTFDSSGTLKTQIQEGADCDVFISAAQKQMNALDIASDKNTDGLDFILSDTRINLVENKITLVVPEGNPAGVSSFDDVAGGAVSAVGLGNSDVPVGQYAEEIFRNMGVWDAIQSKITFGSNVKEVTTWVSEDTVDCGVVYGTDAYSAGLEIVAYAPADLLATPVVYPAAVLKNSQNTEAAKAFLDYLQTDECAAVFEGVGFSIPE